MGRYRSAFTQKAGVCIVSCVAPVLSEIYLLEVDRSVRNDLKQFQEKELVTVLRYADGYLTIHDRSVGKPKIISTFKRQSLGLQFTEEQCESRSLQFLDLQLHISVSGLCWSCQQRSKEPVLPFSSSHSKTEKKVGIVKSVLHSSLIKSCPLRCLKY